MTDIKIDIETEANTRGVDETAKSVAGLGGGLTELEAKAKKAAVAAAALGAAFAAYRAAKDFIADSISAALEADKAFARLKSVAGGMAESLQAQADAMQATLGVEGESVMRMQELALRYGVSADKLQGLITATLDYAAATGNDATAALNRMLVGIDNGGAGLAKMGVHYQTTGEYGKDLDLVVEQLANRWGGSAKTAAESLAGQAHALGLAWEETKESFGGWLLKAAEGIGLTNLLKTAVSELNYVVMGSYAADKERTERQERLNYLGEILYQQTKKLQELETKRYNPLYSAEAVLEFKEQERQKSQALIDTTKQEIEAIKAKQRATSEAMQAQAAAEEVSKVEANRPTAKSVEGRAKEISDAKKHEEELQKAVLEAMSEGERLQEQAEQRHEAEDNSRWEAERRSVQDGAQRVQDALNDGAELERQAREARDKEEGDRREAAYLAQEEAVKASTERLRSMALQSGQLLLSTVSSVLRGQASAEQNYQREVGRLRQQYARDMETARRASGEASEALGRESLERLQRGMKEAARAKEFEPFQVIKMAIPVLISIALSSQPATAPYAALVGQAVGVMLNSFHEGGWVGEAPPVRRETPAMLLQGERVLSHQEVRDMGGPSAVDALAQGYGEGRGSRGGAQINLSVTTLDAASFRRYLDEDGGRAFARSVAGGRGEAAQLIRRIARR